MAMRGRSIGERREEKRREEKRREERKQETTWAPVAGRLANGAPCFNDT
jgi:hypothetical protein